MISPYQSGIDGISDESTSLKRETPGSDSMIPASLLQYAWRSGAARTLQAEIESNSVSKIEPIIALPEKFHPKVGDWIPKRVTTLSS